MKIAVLSGKGGTGKTTIAVNLSVNKENAVLIDTDVEEPNSHIFLKPSIEETILVKKSYPVVDAEKCTLCGDCGNFCRYNAILPAKNKVIVFEELCHECEGCGLVCPEKAIRYEQREIGKIFVGKSNHNVDMKYGDLNVGEVSGVKIIEKLKEMTKDEELLIIDSPPGTSCSTVAAIEGVDYALIVSEPTPFGVSDMKMVVEMLRNMNIQFGVLVNKAGLGDNDVEIANLYAAGDNQSYKIEAYKEKMISVLDKII